MKISPARKAAFDLLVRLERQQALSSTLFSDVAPALETRDRGLLYQLTLGVLRKQRYLDRIIDELASKPIADLEVRTALRLGVFQLRFLDRIPDHSAVNESVQLVVAAKKSSARGLVNAILRRVARDDIDLTFADETERVAIEESMPDWLLRRWIEKFGPERGLAIARSSNAEPETAFWLTEKFDGRRETFLELGFRESEFVPNSYIGDAAIEPLRELSEAGKLYFQDHASQLVANAVGSIGSGSILDDCAAPGGKTSYISLRNTGRIVAGDITSRRVALLKETVEKYASRDIAIVQYDAAVGLPFRSESFDTVFVDAPCTGTGTIRHNPELRYRLSPDDITQSSAKQLRILLEASKLVSSGGSLIYSTCSLEPEENESVVAEFVGTSNRFQLVRPTFPERFIGEDGFARTFPDRDGLDGFFLAVMRNKGV